MSTLGYVSATSTPVQQPESAVLAIYLGFAVLPAVCMALSFISLINYRLTDADLAEPDETESPADSK